MTRFLKVLFVASLMLHEVLAAAEMSFLYVHQMAQSEAPELSLARYRVDGAEAQKDVATGKILPQVTLFGQFSSNRVNYETNNIFTRDQEYNGHRYGVQVKQPLLNVPDGLEALRLDLVYQQSKEELKVVENEVFVGLVEAYLNVLLADADVVQYEAELLALQGQLEESTALFDRKLLPLTQLLEIQTRTERVRADLSMARGNASVVREQLGKLTGQNDIEPRRVVDVVSLVNPFGSPEVAASVAVTRSPSIAAAETALSAARRAIQREQSTWVPNIDVTYSYQYADVGFDNLQSPPRDTSVIAIGFNYPIFEGGSKGARLRGARAEYHGVETQLKAEIREAEARARGAWLTLEAAGEGLIASRRAIQSAETNVDAARKAVTAGISRLSDVLVALAQNTKAQREFALAKFTYAMAWVELEMATGANPNAIAPTFSTALHGD